MSGRLIESKNEGLMRKLLREIVPFKIDASISFASISTKKHKYFSIKKLTIELVILSYSSQGLIILLLLYQFIHDYILYIYIH